MLGINYESSEEEEDIVSQLDANSPVESTTPSTIAVPIKELVAQISHDGPQQGPGALDSSTDAIQSDSEPPGSPYTTTRQLIQNLTLPSVPNWDIPSSPPGSPDARSTKKFAQFLDLKKKGIHFNQRLEGSSVFKDPGHLKRLMDFAGISDEDQHESSLSEEVAVPTQWPAWAYADELNASHRRIARVKAEEKSRKPRDAIEFVTAKQPSSVSVDRTSR